MIEEDGTFKTEKIYKKEKEEIRYESKIDGILMKYA